MKVRGCTIGLCTVSRRIRCGLNMDMSLEDRVPSTLEISNRRKGVVYKLRFWFIVIHRVQIKKVPLIFLL